MVLSVAAARAQIAAQVVDGADNSITPSKLRQVLLDAIDALNGLMTSVYSFQGGWNPTLGSFPGGGAAIAGQVWRATASGTVNGQAFDANDDILALVNNASTSTYAGNWQIMQGVISAADISDASANGRSLITAADYAAMRTLLSITSGLTSFNGRSTAAAVPANDDYAATMLQAIAAYSLVGNNTGSSARPIVLTVAQAQALLGLLSSTTAGRIPFFSSAAGALSQDTNFFWDNTNKRLGIGTASPAEAVHSTGNVRADGKFVGANAPKSWVNITGASGAIEASHNVTSVTRNGAGDYTITHPALSAATQCVLVSCTQDAGSALAFGMVTARTTTTTRVNFVKRADGTADDPVTAFVLIFGT